MNCNVDKRGGGAGATTEERREQPERGRPRPLHTEMSYREGIKISPSPRCSSGNYRHNINSQPWYHREEDTLNKLKPAFIILFFFFFFFRPEVISKKRGQVATLYCNLRKGQFKTIYCDSSLYSHQSFLVEYDTITCNNSSPLSLSLSHFKILPRD